MHGHFRYYLVAATFTSGLVFALVCATPSWASGVTVIVDEAGRKIYVNADEQQAQRYFLPGTHHPDSRSKVPDSGYRISNHTLAGLIEKTAERFQVDPELVDAVVKVESEYNPRARSPKGALGLMQLIPATAERFGVGDPFDPEQNLEGGVTYLKYLLDLFQGDLNLSLAAYNAGENAVLRQHSIPSFSETRNYVRKVKALYTGPASKAEASKVAARIYQYVDAEGVAHYEQ